MEKKNRIKEGINFKSSGNTVWRFWNFLIYGIFCGAGWYLYCNKELLEKSHIPEIVVKIFSIIFTVIASIMLLRFLFAWVLGFMQKKIKRYGKYSFGIITELRTKTIKYRGTLHQYFCKYLFMDENGDLYTNSCQVSKKVFKKLKNEKYVTIKVFRGSAVIYGEPKDVSDEDRDKFFSWYNQIKK